MYTALQERKTRVKVNFMIDSELMEQIRNLVPDGDRSDFANHAFDQALIHFRLKKMSDGIDALRGKNKIYLPTKEIIRLRDEGRK